MEQVNLECKRGDSWSRELYFYDEDNAPIDITGWKIYFMVKAKMDDLDAAAVISKTITTHTDPTNGETTLQLSSSDTNLTGKNYVYAIKVLTTETIGANLEALTVMEGSIVFTDRVVQAIS
jgi:hypothetical protein